MPINFVDVNKNAIVYNKKMFKYNNLIYYKYHI